MDDSIPDINPEKKNLRDWLRDELGIPESFVDSLRDDSDWVFVIKVHSLIEAGMNKLLITYFHAHSPIARDEKAIEKFVKDLPTSGDSVGKTGLLAALKLIPPVMKKYVRTLSEVRNKLVHDPRNYGFTFSSHVAGLDDNQRTNWEEAMLTSYETMFQGEGKLAKAELNDDPKVVTLSNALIIMAELKRFQQWVESRNAAFENARRVLEETREPPSESIPTE